MSSINAIAQGLPAAGAGASAAAPKVDPKLRKAADGFEAIFVNKLIEAARAAKLGDGLVDSPAIDTSQQMLDAALSKDIAGHTGLGIADALIRQFTRPPHSEG